MNKYKFCGTFIHYIRLSKFEFTKFRMLIALLDTWLITLLNLLWDLVLTCVIAVVVVVLETLLLVRDVLIVAWQQRSIALL